MSLTLHPYLRTYLHTCKITAPWFLGTLAEFKAEYVDDIKRGQAEDASDSARERANTAAMALRLKLRRILIRRTRSDILKSILPPRRVNNYHKAQIAP